MSGFPRASSQLGILLGPSLLAVPDLHSTGMTSGVVPEPSNHPSIHVLRPREQGGPTARRGFTYQDHVAVAFYLEMLADDRLAFVWCEAQDDITLIWHQGGGDSVEFVQVKNEQLEQLWTAALVCRRERHGDNGNSEDSRAEEAKGVEPSADAGASTTAAVHELAPESLLEKSLAHERCAEPCTFRVVTSTPLHPDLVVLTYHLHHDHRVDGHSAIEDVVTNVATSAERGGRRFLSSKGNDARSWVRRVVWDVRESQTAVVNSNYRSLDKFVENEGGFLMIDQRDDLYLKLLAQAKEAADAPWDPNPLRKKLARAALLDFMRAEIRKAEHPSQAAGAERLREKMEAAALPDAQIESAWELRRAYRKAMLDSKFLTLDERELVEAEVQARLHELLASLHANRFDDTSAAFHDRCIQALRELRDGLPVQPQMSILLGMMYDITARCRHQFTRLTSTDRPSSRHPAESAGPGAAA